MNAMTSLLQKMESLQLYDLSQGSRVRAELEAYACALAPLAEELDELEAEMMVATAQGQGLEQYEGLLPALNRDPSVEGRRRRVLAALGTKPSDTVEELEQRALQLFGLEGTFSEAPGEWQLHLPTELDIDEFIEVTQRMGELKPMGVRLIIDEEI